MFWNSAVNGAINHEGIYKDFFKDHTHTNENKSFRENKKFFKKKYKKDTVSSCDTNEVKNVVDACQTGYDYEQDQLNKLENENMELKKQLVIVKRALKDIIEDYNDYGPCEGDCVGYDMYCTAKRALKN